MTKQQSRKNLEISKTINNMEHEYMRTHYGEKYWDKLCGKPMPEESTPPIWKENYLLQQQYIEELERELNAVNQRIKRLEEAGDDLMEEDCIYTRRKTWKKAKEDNL